MGGSSRAPSCSLILGFYGLVVYGLADLFGALYFSTTCGIHEDINNELEEMVSVTEKNIDILSFDNR